MTSTLNPHYLSEMDATPTNQLRDDLDFPHSGIFKALHLASRGTYALKDTGVDFDITQSNNSGFTRLAVKGGKAYRDGALVTLGSGVGTTTNIDCTASYNPGGGPVDVTPSTSGDVYLFLVGNSSNALVLRGSNAATNAVPELVEGDVPIAVVKVVANSADSASDRPIQYLTTSKVANTVSVGYDSSGYTEAGSLTGSASGIKIDAALEVEQGASGGQTAFIIDNNDTDKVAMSIEAANIDADVMDISADAVTTANVIDITADALTTGSVLNIISDSSSTGTRNIAYIKNDHASAVNTTTLKLESDATDGSNDVSTAPVLHVKTASAGTAIKVESTVASADEAPEITLLSSAGSGGSGVAAASDDIGYIQFLGPDAGSATASQQYVELRADIKTATAGAEKGRFLIRTYLGGTGYINNFQVQPDSVIINDSSVDHDFRVESNDETHMLFVDGGNNRVSIGDSTDAPAATLEITNNASAGAYNVPLLQLNSNDVDQVAIDINAANTTANIIDISSDDALTTGKVLHIDVNNDATTAITPTYMHFDFDKDGVVGDGVTSTFTAWDVDMNDGATNHANSNVTMTGLDLDVVSANATGTLTNVGIDINVTGADTNIGIDMNASSMIGNLKDVKTNATSSALDLEAVDSGCRVLLTSTGGVNLPIAAEGIYYYIINFSGSDLTVARDGSDTINGSGNYTLAASTHIEIICNAAGQWALISGGNAA